MKNCLVWLLIESAGQLTNLAYRIDPVYACRLKADRVVRMWSGIIGGLLTRIKGK